MTPAGPMSLFMLGVRGLFANSTVWQAWTGTTDAVDPVLEAGNRVHFYGPPAAASISDGATRDELETLRPFVVLTLRPPFELSTRNRALFRSRRDGSSYLNGYTLFAYLCADVPDLYAPEAQAPLAYQWFQNQLGLLIEDLWTQTFSNIADLSYLQAVDLAFGPQRNQRTFNATQGNFIEALLEIDAGVQAG